jgi:hypothetical protein
MLLISFMAYRSPLEIRDGLVTIPDTPLFSDRHHPVFRIARRRQQKASSVGFNPLDGRLRARRAIARRGVERPSQPVLP